MPTTKINNGDFQGDQNAESIFESFNKVNQNNTLIDNLEIEIENVRGEIPTATLPEANVTAGVVEGDTVNAPSNDGVFKYPLSNSYNNQNFGNQNIVLNPVFNQGLDSFRILNQSGNHLETSIVNGFENPFESLGYSSFKVVSKRTSSGISDIQLIQEISVNNELPTDYNYYFLVGGNVRTSDNSNSSFTNVSILILAKTDTGSVSFVVNRTAFSSSNREDFGNGITLLKSDTFTLPANIVSIEARARFQAHTSAPLDVDSPTYLSSLALNKGSVRLSSPVNGLNIITQNLTARKFVENAVLNANRRIGKITFYGDSLSTTDYTWTFLVSKYFGLTRKNSGVGGSTVIPNNHVAWLDGNGDYLARSSNGGTQPTGSNEVSDSMSALDRIQAMIPSDSNYVNIFGGTNDAFQGLANGLGTIDDLTGDTFYHSYQLMLDRAQAQAPNALFFMTIPPHKEPETIEFIQVREAVKNIAVKYKIPIVDLGLTGINKNNHATFLSDNVHPNVLGDNRFAIEFVDVILKHTRNI